MDEILEKIKYMFYILNYKIKVNYIHMFIKFFKTLDFWVFEYIIKWGLMTVDVAA